MSTLDTMVRAQLDALRNADLSDSTQTREYWLGKVAAYAHVIQVLRAVPRAQFVATVRDNKTYWTKVSA